MATKRSKRKFRKYLKGRCQITLDMGTLAASTLIGAVLSDNLDEKAWLTSVKLRWSMSNFVPASGDGPITVGVAHSDYSDAEIEAWFEQSASWQQADKIQQEVARRKIREVGTFHVPPDATSAHIQVLNDGKSITTKCGWQLTTGQSIKIWAFNFGTGAITSGLVKTTGHANLWPN